MQFVPEVARSRAARCLTQMGQHSNSFALAALPPTALSAAAVMGRPLYDVTNEAISDYLSGLKLGDPLAAIRRAGRARR